MEKQRFIFDLDGTLLKANYSYEMAYFNSVLGEGDAKIVLSKLGRILESYERNFTSYDELSLSQYLTFESGVVISPKVIDGWRDALKLVQPEVIDGAFEMLEYLKSQNKSLVVLSNWFLEDQIFRIAKSGLSDYITEVYGGSYFLKPSRESYLTACGSYPLTQCIMIGDSLEKDVNGAVNIGLDAIYYNPKANNSFDRNKVKSIGSLKMIKEIY